MKFVSGSRKRLVLAGALLVGASVLSAGVAVRHSKPAEIIPQELIPARDIALLPTATPVKFDDQPRQTATDKVRQPRRTTRPAPKMVVPVAAHSAKTEPVIASAPKSAEAACERCPETVPDQTADVAASGPSAATSAAPQPDVYVPGSIGRAKNGSSVDTGPVTDGGYDSVGRTGRGGHGGGGGGGGRCPGRGGRRG